jgi:hypothetical protein
MNVVEIQVL